MKHYFIVIVCLLFLLSCNTENQKNSYTAEIDTIDIKSHIKILASDDFYGRKPFTAGETKTVAYLQEQFEAMGLSPANNGSFLQEVPMVELTAVPDKKLKISNPDSDLNLSIGSDFVAFTERAEEEVTLKDAELVFAGYGIVAPEYNWNDYDGIDVKNKVVVVLVNDPGFGSDDPDLFKGETMTYYGRWTYKYEEAARQGAAGVFIIHETVPAGYPWLVVRNSWSGASLYLDSGNDGYKSKIQGWLSRDAAIRIFESSDTDMRNFKESARSSDFKPVSLGLSMDLTVRNKIDKAVSYNVVAKVEGKNTPEEAVIYTAHWDHLGIGPEVDGDSIYNGAHDNASGVAAMLAIAKAFSDSPKPDRSVIFLAVTAEEQGLLGSRYYAENPIYPPSETVANLNLDGVPSYGLMKDFTVVGYGQSELDDLAEKIAEKQGRYIKADPEPGKGYFFRSDHFNFAKIGVPALFGSGSYEAVTGGTERVRKLSAEYAASQYHRPADEFVAEKWRFGGILQDAELYFQLGYELADSEFWPKWKEGSEFKQIREK